MSQTQQQRIDKAVREKQKRIDKAISHKDRSIAYFNSLNAAINLVTPLCKKPAQLKEMEGLKPLLLNWRNWFYDEWLKWNSEETQKPENQSPIIQESLKQEAQVTEARSEAFYEKQDKI